MIYTSICIHGTLLSNCFPVVPFEIPIKQIPETISNALRRDQLILIHMVKLREWTELEARRDQLILIQMVKLREWTELQPPECWVIESCLRKTASWPAWICLFSKLMGLIQQFQESTARRCTRYLSKRRVLDIQVGPKAYNLCTLKVLLRTYCNNILCLFQEHFLGIPPINSPILIFLSAVIAQR